MWLDELRMRSRAWHPTMHQWFMRAVAFDVTQIVDYVVKHQSGVDLMNKDIPNCAPLAPIMYFEWDAPQKPQGRAALLARAYGCVGDSGESDGWLLTALMIERRPDDEGFIYGLAGPLYDIQPDGAVSPSQCRIATLRHDGGMLDVGSMTEDMDAVTPLDPDELSSDDRAIIDHECISARMAMVAMCFAHCKGVTLTEHAQPRQQRRAAERAGKPPLVTYRTIDIAPVTRILHDEGGIEHNGIKKALHICRGHFAHYTEDAPLFGRYTGTFFKPMHVRGSMARGVVVKDYNVTDKAAHLT